MTEQAEKSPASKPVPDHLFAEMTGLPIMGIITIFLGIVVAAVAATFGKIPGDGGGGSPMSVFLIGAFLTPMVLRTYIAARYGLRASFTMRLCPSSKRFREMAETRDRVMDKISVPFYAFSVILITAMLLLVEAPLIPRFRPRREGETLILLIATHAVIIGWFVPYFFVRLYAFIRFGYEGMRSLGLPWDAKSDPVEPQPKA